MKMVCILHIHGNVYAVWGSSEGGEKKITFQKKIAKVIISWDWVSEKKPKLINLIIANFQPKKKLFDYILTDGLTLPLIWIVGKRYNRPYGGETNKKQNN
ncbi:unnamed protein product [Prunus armeniaca]